MERSLGVRLFERGSASLRLTDAGRALLAATRGPLEDLAAAEEVLRGDGGELRGKLRVSVPLMVGQQVVGDLAARFLSRHPHVSLEIVADDRYVDLVQEGFDVAIRARPAPEERLVGRRVLSTGLIVIAAPSLARPSSGTGGGAPRVPAVVRALGAEPGSWELDDDGMRIALKPEPVLRVSTLAVLDAVRAGAGAALFPLFFVEKDLAEGKLVSWGKLVGEPLEFWVLHASARLPSRRLHAFMNMVSDAFDRDKDRALAAEQQDGA